MNLYLISQAERRYDTYDSAVVAAESEEAARNIHPKGPRPSAWERDRNYTWASRPENVEAKLLGQATPGTQAGVVLASFNAG